MEIQNTGDNVATLINSFSNRNSAESKYHQILMSAAISQITTHTAALLTDTGKLLKSEFYRHEPEEELEVEQEQE